ncbi:MAG: dihydrofolate reductase [Tepidisphaeraceae bacterium]
MTRAAQPGLELVAAVAANGVIGKGGQLAWHLPDDLRHFKRLTFGHAIIMGRRTYESIGRPLPGRRSIVISTTLEKPPHTDVFLARSLDDALGLVSGAPGPAFVIGGAVLYAAAMPRVRVMHLTELDEPVEGDVMFPPFDRTQWRRVSAVPHPRDDRHAIGFTFSRYERE